MGHTAVAETPGQIGQDLCHCDGMVTVVEQAHVMLGIHTGLRQQVGKITAHKAPGDDGYH